MNKPHTWKEIVLSDLGILSLVALAGFLLHMLTNGQYGFHRDELAVLDSARHLDWGYVEYPPLTAFVVRMALVLFGPGLVGVRVPAALAHSIAMLLTGLMARELGGARWAQVIAALAVAIAPQSLFLGTVVMYTTFDYLWWVVIAYLVIRLLKTEDPRWWLGIGATIGLAMLTKYSVSFYVAGVVVGVVLTKTRRHLLSPWLWGGVGLALLIFLPNLIWVVQHHFISLDFLNSIHARDIGIGRTGSFLVEQLYISANLVTIPLWAAGLCFYLFAPAGQRYRLLAWMFIVPLGLFLFAKGRGYYLAPAYPLLLAAGAVFIGQWLTSLSLAAARLVRGVTWGALAAGFAGFVWLAIPLAPVNTPLWKQATKINDGFKEEIGWPELVETVANIYAALPAEEKPQAGIFANNYGEAGAISFYGPAYGLPEVISGANSFWLRGYGNPPPQTVIVLGVPATAAYGFFQSCTLGGVITNRYGVLNEEVRDHSAIYVCRSPRRPWSDVWASLQSFG